MAKQTQYAPGSTAQTIGIPFDSAEEAWFWFIQGMKARNDGARFQSGCGLYPRPCEPLDILKVVDRLRRNRRLVKDHLLVLKHYGFRMTPPDRFHVREMRSHRIWCEAIGRIEEILISKGIVKPKSKFHKENAS